MSTIKKESIEELLKLAMREGNEEASQGVLEIKELLSQNEKYEVELNSIKKDTDNKMAKLEKELDKATRTIGSLIASNGVAPLDVDEIDNQSKREELYKKFSI